MFRSTLLTACLVSLLAVTDVLAGSPLIELTTRRGDSWQGRPVVHNEQTCWLEQTDGRLQQVDLAEVTDFRKVSDDYRTISPMELRTPLAQEFGREFEVQVRGKYVIVAPQGTAREFAQLFDSVYRTYWSFFSRRNFGLAQPQHPLVVIIFPNQDQFASYSRTDDIQASDTLKGYYHTHSNRIAMFIQGDGQASGPGEEPQPETKLTSDKEPLDSRLERYGLSSLKGQLPENVSNKDLEALRKLTTFSPSVDTGTQATLIHEGTHQLAFNTGLHSRIGETPRWVVEGLAMLFEAEMNPDSPKGPRGGPVNVQRLERFREFQSKRAHTIADMVANEDRLFQASVLDAYAEAWALSYFLAETRSTAYAGYLKRIAARDVLTEYAPADRLADFQASFGNDLKWLEVQFLRFMDGVE